MSIRSCWSLALIILLNSLSLAAEPFQVMSYNIRYLNKSDGQDVWANRRDVVVETIQRADIVGLQEVVAEQFDFVSEAASELQWYGVARNDGQLAGEMTPIGWRKQRFVAIEQGTFWLSDQPTRIGKSGWDAALPRIASWVRLVDREGSTDSADDRTLLVVNAHFDHQGAQARKESAAQIRRWIARERGVADVVMMGDLNAQLDSPPLQQFLDPSASEAAPLVDARAASPIPDSGPDSTWNGFKKIQLGSRIDHILLQSTELKVVGFETLDPRTQDDRFASDHLPITARLQW